MLGSRTGLAARLKEVNSRIISIHCICHKLALACVDTAKDVEYIGTVEDLLRQLWKYLENSPKRMAAYLKVQQEVKSFDLSEKSRKVITKKLKKACQTRWLSLGHAVEAIFDDLEALMRTLRLFERDATACGLLKKIHCPKFIGCVYILKHVLPVLSQLSKSFQRGCVNFSHIAPAMGHSKHKLQDILDEGLPLKQFKQDLEAGGRLATLELSPTESQIQQQERLLSQYVSSLKVNIDQRFSSALPILKAFAIFDVMMVPPPESVSLKQYGLNHIETLAKHFYTESSPGCEVKKQQLEAEWGKFKFDLLEWKKVVPKDVVDGKCPSVTTTTWTLQHMLKQPSYRHFYPALSSLAECCLSIPISNAWPERGASSLKRIKTRLRSRLQNDMLQALMQISINGPALHSDQCKVVVRDSVQLWLKQKNRRSLPKQRAKDHPASVSEPRVEMADVAVQVGAADQTEVSPNETALRCEVEAAAAALKLTDQPDDSDYDSEYDDGDIE